MRVLYIKSITLKNFGKWEDEHPYTHDGYVRRNDTYRYTLIYDFHVDGGEDNFKLAVDYRTSVDAQLPKKYLKQRIRQRVENSFFLDIGRYVHDRFGGCGVIVKKVQRFNIDRGINNYKLTGSEHFLYK